MIQDALTCNYMLYLVLPVAFVTGSIPFGIIFTRNSGVDIRKSGSRNIGATNVLRTTGKVPAVLTLLGDLAKGVIALKICGFMLNSTSGCPAEGFTHDLWMGLAGILAVLGHMYSIFLGFRGGKGVATGFGVLIVYSPASAGIVLLIWLAAAGLSGYSSVGALSAVSAMPVVMWFIDSSLTKVVVGLVLAIFIILKHRSNIRNLLEGKEGRIGGKRVGSKQ
jgi:glycerol-3-phosphate acyltransferase PlsY